MASHNFICTLFFLLPLVSVVITTNVYPFTCSNTTKSCNAILYQYNDLQEEKIASLYDVDISQIIPINGPNKQDYLVSVPCSCENVTNTLAYFHNTIYNVQPNDTFYNISTQLFSGQLWEASAGNSSLRAGENVTLHLLCGCDASQNMVTYTVQERDTLQSIADLLYSDINDILHWNPYLGTNPSYLQVGWVMYVPMGINSSSSPGPSPPKIPGDLSPPIPGGPENDKDSNAQDPVAKPYRIFGYLVVVASMILQW